MAKTTTVRIAVPKLDSTPEMPILPRMAVRLAKTAEPRAYHSQRESFAAAPLLSFFSIIRKVPTAISTTPTPFVHVMPSCRRMAASKMVSTVLDLSTGTTLFTSPSCNARK